MRIIPIWTPENRLGEDPRTSAGNAAAAPAVRIGGARRGIRRGRTEKTLQRKCLLFLWGLRRRRKSAFKKGYIAERQIGRALEEAITAKGCAIAHSVTGVMKSGDIDHIVATPQGVWVIETKYRRVPEERFSDVLSRLHACRARVEALLPSDTPVRACLVLAYEESSVKPKRDRILVYNNDTFRSEFLVRMRAERLGSGVVVDKRTSSTIWRLSRGEAVPELATADLQEATVDGFPADSATSRKEQPSKRFPNAYRTVDTRGRQSTSAVARGGMGRDKACEPLR